MTQRTRVVRRRGWLGAISMSLALTLAALGQVTPAQGAAPPAPPGDNPSVGVVDVTDWPGNEPNTREGVDYYIDSQAGDDENPGTSTDQPWKTLSKANATTFQPGDRILLKAGSEWHDEQLWPKGSGTAERPISIDAYGDPEAGRPYIAANGTTPHPFVGSPTYSGSTNRSPVKNVETVGTTGAVVLRNQQGWEIANLELSNDDDFATDITGGNTVRDGVSITINADLLNDGDDKIMDYFRISNLYVHNVDGPSSWQSIHYGGIVFQVFGEKQYREYEEGAYYFQDVEITNNTLENVELHAIQFAFNWFYDRDAGSGYADETGKFHEGWEQLWVRDRDLYSRDVYIANNYAKDIGQGAVQLANTKDMTVEYNEVNGFLQRYTQVSAGLYLWAGADSVMQFNEVYDGPYHEYDATPWDLEFTNFNVTYQYNYSHDNKGGWMSYMGNSGNSIARYNLSVNDNGVIVKNMLSTNYSPTYFLNNVFVYDAAEMDWFHDEVFIDTVYFLNNVFYNYSTTETTPWYRKAGALDRAVFSNNAFYEASGEYSELQPDDAGAVLGDPKFVGDVADYEKRGGVTNIVDSASLFALQEDSPLIDAGRYNPRVGDEDFFGTHLYYGNGIDIGIQEQQIGRQITNPVDTDPIEEEGQDDRQNLALGAEAVATSTHPHQNYSLHAGNLVDGNFSTRWAAADDATYPLDIDLTFDEAIEFDEVLLAEHLDSGTNARVAAFALYAWDEAEQDWTEFYSDESGIGAEKSVTFDPVTSSRLRVSLLGLRPGEIWAPTMTEIQVYRTPAEPEPANPVVTPELAAYDKAEEVRGTPNNTVSFEIDPDGSVLGTIRYIGTEGNVLGSLTEGEDYVYQEGDDGDQVSITDDFLAGRPLGGSGLRFEFATGIYRDVRVVVIDSSDLVEQLAAFDAVAEEDSSGYRALAAVAADAREVLALSNREVPAANNDAITQDMLDETAQRLRQSLAGYVAEGPGEPSPEPSESGEPSPEPSESGEPSPEPSGTGEPSPEPGEPSETPSPSDPSSTPGPGTARPGLPKTGVSC